ncbi:Pyruvate kinase [Nowakowskiella sp. JEL0407]|nr:Pyruvate kinase [Nowakowskiella sp. JEL0407]
MDILRINLSHTTHEVASQIITDLHDYIDEAKIAAEVGVWVDINGPKVRTGKLPEGKDVYVEQGADFFFVNDISLIGDNTKIATTYTKELVNIGDKIFVDDGAMSFTVVERLADSIRTEADHSGYVGENKGINFPSHVIEELPALSEKDKKDLNFALDTGVDFISLSCIRNIEDVEEARLMLGNSKAKLLAKIENERSMQNFESILRLADGIVIDRGYLGAEVDVEVVTMNQKKMVALANIAGKPILVASQMLESMRVSARPTRSEAADIANTVMDGVDGLVLSAETAVGRYPVEAVETMRRIAISAEHNVNYYEYQLKMMRSIPKPVGVSESIASSAVTMARQVNASIIICATELGGTVLTPFIARLVAKYRPQIPVLAATCIKQTARQLNMCFGLRMYHHKGPIETVVDGTLRYAVEIGLAKPGQIAVVTSGQVVGFLEGVTTKMQVVTVPEFTD